jgi:ketosteroid isomerase-like protein
VSTTELDAFLAGTLADHIHAERAIHEGHVSPRLATWSHDEPVTLFGAGVPYRCGWPSVRETFDWVASTFTACDDYTFELLTAGVDRELAYTVGIERYCATRNSGATVDHEIRVTHVYRREAGGWRIIHRHGDHVPRDVMVGG